MFLPLQIQHHLSIMSIWFLLHIQAQTHTPLCIMISKHLLTYPDKDTALDTTLDVMSKAFPFQLKRCPSSGFLWRNLSIGLGEIWRKLQPVGTCSYSEGSTGKWEVERFQRGRAGVLSGLCPHHQPGWMTGWASQAKGTDMPQRVEPAL